MKYVSQKGMTLLELLIATGLFTMIAVSLTRMTKSAVQYRTSINKHVSHLRHKRNIFQILKRDIQNTFYLEDLNNTFLLEFVESNDPLPYPLSEKAYYPEVIYVGGFSGTRNTLFLSSFSHTPNHQNAKEGDLNEISYFIKKCKNPKDEESQCLWRKNSLRTDNNVEDIAQQNEYVLLTDISDFSISYYDFLNTKWVNEWKIGPGRRFMLPSVIRISLDSKSKSGKVLSSTFSLVLYQTLLPLTRLTPGMIC